MDPEQLTSLARALESRTYNTRSNAWVLTISPFDLAALMRPVVPALNSQAIAAELVRAMTSYDSSKAQEMAAVRKKRDEALASVGDLWLSLHAAEEELHKLKNPPRRTKGRE